MGHAGQTSILVYNNHLLRFLARGRVSAALVDDDNRPMRMCLAFNISVTAPTCMCL